MIINITQLKQENFFGRFYQLVLVNILSNIMLPLAGVVSVAFLGHLTEIYDLAGVAVATVIFNYLYRLLNFLRMGTTGVVAQAVGRDDRETMLLASPPEAPLSIWRRCKGFLIPRRPKCESG